ncbi:GNAT family N-acetyltransferase [Mycetocola reblochoni]|uniref:N-acetyltransferase domain-containing protein n=2 Tax=Mycetocola reblochoni TaxID=331618 RepID=A0A1R4IVP4_9MICO|nr:GNAT family N-acetyltransferase [Mycetocola reblochoni]RLP71001.1 N-acetyltransferase [Mycetocola reblochoni]SJN23759.1 hypothetical protein FM119_03800 [Mycetocola reblochoni REB411]
MPEAAPLLPRVVDELTRRGVAAAADPYRHEDAPAVLAFVDATPSLGGRAFRARSGELDAFLDGVDPTGHGRVVVRVGGGVAAVVAAAPPGDADPSAIVILVDGDAPAVLTDALVSATVTPAPAQTITTDRQTSLRAALGRKGFHVVRRFSRMHRTLTGPDRAGAAPPDGLRILTGTELRREGLLDELRLTHNASFADHWGPMTKTDEQWHTYLDGPAFIPELTLAAVAEGPGGPRIAAYALNTHYVDTATGRAVESVHTDFLGVPPEYRRRGLGPLLLSELWARAAQAGLSTASLGADLENRHRAAALYRSLGYREVETATAHLRAPSPADRSPEDHSAAAHSGTETETRSDTETG